MQRRLLATTGSIIFAAAVGVAALSGESEFAATARRHITPADPESALAWKNLPHIPTQPEAGPAPIAPPTRSSFMATWQSVRAASGYQLDVSTDASFSSYVNGYHNLDVGNVTGRVVTGLSQDTTYYYRVRAYDAAGTTSESSMVTTATTTAGIGLIIQATFDSSITTRSNAATIEATMNQAIAIYESLFSDPITVQILFRFSTTQPDGSRFPSGVLSESDIVTYAIPWSTFINALKADAKTQNDFTANTTLLTTALTTNIVPSSANGRAVGLNTPPEMFANGTTGGGPYDGIVTLNAAVPFQFSRPTTSGNYDAQRATEHEIDEVLGFGSHLGTGDPDLCPQDLFSWSSAGVRNLTSNGTRYFSINGGSTNIVNFNQDTTADLGDWFSASCPQAHPYVQNAFSCDGQYSDVAATSPEGINLDVIGYDLAHAIVTTTPATNVASFSATLNGTVNPEGLNTAVHFQYGTTTSYGSITANQSFTGKTAQNVSANISGLSASTTYHFRIVASNSAGTYYGADRTFTTLSATGSPVVTTNPATYIASFSATLNSTVDPHGLTTTVYFQYGTTTGYGMTTGMQGKTGNTYQNVSANISGLSATTTYHFRIVAANNAGTVYGADRTFTTLSATGPPVITTKPATYIASFTTTLNGTVDPHGLTTSVHFQYGTTTSYGATTASQSFSGNTYQNVGANISGLSASTTYHFRVVATNSAGTTYGPDQSFTTLSATGTPVVTTNPATNLASSSATLNGTVDPHGLTTTLYFQYGTTTSYGSATALQGKTGNTYQAVSANISGLSASATYHFRIVATNSAGTSYGTDRSFTTP